MIESLLYDINKSDYHDIHKHLMACDISFIPKLSEKVNIIDYSKKIKDNAIRIEAWKEDVLIGLVALYFNNENHFAYITNVSVLNEYKGFGVAKKLLKETLDHTQTLNCEIVKLEVSKSNFNAIRLYNLFGFEIEDENNENYLMKKIVQNEYKGL